MKKNNNDYLILKCLALEETVNQLKNKIKELEVRIDELDTFKIYSPNEIEIKSLPTPETDTDIKHFCMDMKKITSFDLID